MIGFLFFSAFFSTAFGQSYYYAVDISQQGTSTAFTCLKASYSVVFVRAYNPAGAGSVDTNALSNIRNANRAGLGIEVYMTPMPSSTKSAATQVDEVVTALVAGGFTIRTIWIQVSSYGSWSNNQASNLNFITSAIQRLQARSIRPGIYTSGSEWTRITNNARLSSDVMLWYWNVNGSGTAGETPANFNDFRSFGSWTTPTAKQFGQVESICGFIANRDVYPAYSLALKDTKTRADSEENMIIGQSGLYE